MTPNILQISLPVNLHRDLVVHLISAQFVWGRSSFCCSGHGVNKNSFFFVLYSVLTKFFFGVFQRRNTWTLIANKNSHDCGRSVAMEEFFVLLFVVSLVVLLLLFCKILLLLFGRFPCDSCYAEWLVGWMTRLVVWLVGLMDFMTQPRIKKQIPAEYYHQQQSTTKTHF